MLGVLTSRLRRSPVQKTTCKLLSSRPTDDEEEPATKCHVVSFTQISPLDSGTVVTVQYFLVLEALPEVVCRCDILFGKADDKTIFA